MKERLHGIESSRSSSRTFANRATWKLLLHGFVGHPWCCQEAPARLPTAVRNAQNRGPARGRTVTVSENPRRQRRAQGTSPWRCRLRFSISCPVRALAGPRKSVFYTAGPFKAGAGAPGSVRPAHGVLGVAQAYETCHALKLSPESPYACRVKRRDPLPYTSPDWRGAPGRTQVEHKLAAHLAAHTHIVPFMRRRSHRRHGRRSRLPRSRSRAS